MPESLTLLRSIAEGSDLEVLPLEVSPLFDGSAESKQSHLEGKTL